MKNKNKKINFFVWYYENGLHEYLEIWKNFLVFVWTHYSIWELTLTLFSPWKRDVEIRKWRGWDFERMFTLILNNLFTRTIGAIARLMVIFFGLVIFLVTFIIGISILLVWIAFPVLLAFVLYKAFSGSIIYIYSVGGAVIYTLAIIITYKLDTRPNLKKLSFDEMYNEKVFERICNRLGTTKRAFPREVLGNRERLEVFLKEKNLSMDDLSNIVLWETGLVEEKIAKRSFWRKENLAKHGKIGAQWKYAYTVRLDRYSNDLFERDNSEYSDKELEGRKEELGLLKLIMQRPDQNCAIVSGGTGVGKNTLIHSLAEDIRLGKADPFFRNKRMLVLDLGRAISGFISEGLDVEGEVRKLFYEALNAGNIILVIEHFEKYLGKAESTYHPDVAPILIEVLAYPDFQIIGTSSTKEYHNLIEKHEEMLKYFEVIELREPTADETLNIVYGSLETYESNRVIFTHDAIKTAIKESNKYNWSSPLPERALDLVMDSLMFWNNKPESLFINTQTIFDFLSMKTGTPHGEVKASERNKLLSLEKTLHQQVIGQEEAIRQVAEALRRARSGIANSEKPVGSFLFLGPTGVGKTETAKALANTYFGDENKMIRLDMSEFQNPSSIETMLGSSQLNKQGRLTTQVKDNPYSLILLDEIEKAYPEVLDLFLQILDEGFVTDAFGEKINFRNTLIVATSNAGAPLIKEGVENGDSAEKIKAKLIDYIVKNNIFRLEFMNRFDGVIFFRPLHKNELSSVVRLMLQKLSKRISEEKNIDIDFSESVVEEIVTKGYNPIFGARSINHYIDEKIESMIAEKIISGEVVRGQKMKISF